MCENQCLSFFCYLLGFFVCLELFCFSQPQQSSSYKKKKSLSLLQNSRNGEWKYIRCSFGLYLLRSRDKGKRRWGMTQLNLGDFCIIFCCPTCWTALWMEGSSGIRETSLGMLNLMQHPKSAEKAWGFLSFLCQLLLPTIIFNMPMIVKRFFGGLCYSNLPQFGINKSSLKRWGVVRFLCTTLAICMMTVWGGRSHLQLHAST